jgi:hypothetical protein
MECGWAARSGRMKLRGGGGSGESFADARPSMNSIVRVPWHKQQDYGAGERDD